MHLAQCFCSWMKTEAMLTVLLRLATFIILWSCNCLAILTCWLDPYCSHTDHEFTTVASHVNLLGFDSLTLSVLWVLKLRPLPYNFVVWVIRSIKPHVSVSMCEHPYWVSYHTNSHAGSIAHMCALMPIRTYKCQSFMAVHSFIFFKHFQVYMIITKWEDS